VASDTEAARKAIEEAFELGWNGQTPIHWAGVHADPPSDADTWIRLTIIWLEPFEETTAENRLPGLLEIQVFGRAGRGYGPLNAVVDAARDLFNRASLTGGIEFEVPSPGKIVGNRDGWLQVNVSTPFWAHETP
jgi:hypothetical protein